MSRARTERPYIHPLLHRAREETSLLGFVNILLKHRRLIVATTLVSFVVFVLATRTDEVRYTTRTLFTVRGATGGSLSDVAAQYGLSVGGSDPSQSIEFYEELLRSPELLREVAKHQYQVHTPRGTITGTLPKFYGIHAGSREAEFVFTADAIRAGITTNATRRTGIVSFVLSAPYPELAQQLSQNMVAELERYNTERRRSAIVAERQFIEQRMADARAALSRAENDWMTFRELNREINSSPALSLENDRLTREVSRRQSLYTSLSAAYERARIEEVRDTPIISIVEPPELPTYPDPNFGARDSLIGAIAGMLIGIVLAFVRERFEETKADAAPVFATYSELKSETISDLKRPWRRVGRLLKPNAEVREVEAKS